MSRVATRPSSRNKMANLSNERVNVEQKRLFVGRFSLEVDAPNAGRQGAVRVLALRAAGAGRPKRRPPASAGRRRPTVELSLQPHTAHSNRAGTRSNAALPRPPRPARSMTTH